MGCQNSQATDLAPQEPHLLDEGNLQSPQIHPENKAAAPDPKTQHSEDRGLLSPADKQNLKPSGGVSKGEDKVEKEKENAPGDTCCTKKKSKSEQIIEEMPIVDATNHPKDNLVMKDKKLIHNRDSKRLSSRSAYKAEEELSQGPSSKSIQAPEPLPPNTGEEAFPITDVLKEQDHSSAKPEEECPPLLPQQSGPSDKVQLLEPFVFEQWEKGEAEEEEEDVMKAEVQKYLGRVLALEWQMVDAVIARMEEKEHKKYE